MGAPQFRKSRRHQASWFLVTALCAHIWAQNAWAVPTDYAFTQVPSRFQTDNLTAGSRGLGEICYSRDIMPDGTVCDPAFLGELDDSSLMLRIFLGNGYEALSTANQFIYQPLTNAFLQSLFQNQNVTSFEGNAEIVFSTRHFSAAFSPYRVQFLSEVQNPNFPVVAVDAAIEKSFEFSGGASLEGLSPVLEKFSLGAKLTLFQRNFVHGSFSLFQALSQDPRTLLPSQEQKGVFLDPAIGWVNDDLSWHPRLSVSTQNLGFSGPATPAFPNTMDLALGAGVAPTLGVGTLRVGLDFVNLIHGEGMLDRIRLGTSYKFGILETMVGYNSDSVTAGFQFFLQIVRVSVVYELHRDDLDTNTFEDRIATEFAVQL